MSAQLILVCQWLWISQVGAPAEGKSSAEIARQAKLECAAGDYQAGIRLLAQLWVTSQDATWIYNQARCYEQNGQNDLAAARFREYLRVAKSLPDDEIKDIRNRIEELQRLSAGATPLGAGVTPIPAAGSTESAASPSPSATPVGVRATPPPAVGSAESATSPSLPAAVPPPSEPSLAIEPQGQTTPPIYKRWWFWSAGALVVGATVATILLSTGAAPRSPGCDVGVLCATKN